MKAEQKVDALYDLRCQSVSSPVYVTRSRYVVLVFTLKLDPSIRTTESRVVCSIIKETMPAHLTNLIIIKLILCYFPASIAAMSTVTHYVQYHGTVYSNTYFIALLLSLVLYNRCGIVLCVCVVLIETLGTGNKKYRYPLYV